MGQVLARYMSQSLVSAFTSHATSLQPTCCSFASGLRDVGQDAEVTSRSYGRGTDIEFKNKKVDMLFLYEYLLCFRYAIEL